jgi:hypothetical protein
MSVYNYLGDNKLEFFAAAFVMTMLTIMYFLPSVIAYVRKHSNFKAILALNFLTGWFGLGWVASFVWSLTDNVKAVE